MSYISLLINFLFFVILYFPLAVPLIKEWMAGDDYSHGFLIPLLSLYFLWTKRQVLKKAVIAPAGMGLVYVACGLALYLLATIGYQFFLQCLSMLIVLYGLVYASAGKEIAKTAAFPISYLIFMIPLPDIVYTKVTFQLRLLSTKLAFFLMNVLGMNATREGNVLHLPTCSLVVANPCSGLRGLIVFVAAAVAMGYLFQTTLKKRLILFGSSIVLAVLMNTLRLTATAFLADIGEVDHVPASVHDMTGLIAMILGLVALFFLNDALKKGK